MSEPGRSCHTVDGNDQVAHPLVVAEGQLGRQALKDIFNRLLHQVSLALD